MKDVVFVTGNQSKADYYAKMVGISLRRENITLDEIQSTKIEDVATHKAKQAYEILKQPVLVEDVGLFFNALDGLPGPFIKMFVDTKNGLSNLCRMLDGFNDRSAYTKVIVAYYDGKKLQLFSGGHKGTIALKPSGLGGFGYDSIWCIEGYGGRTRAELTPEEDLKTYAEAHPVKELQHFFGVSHE